MATQTKLLSFRLSPELTARVKAEAEKFHVSTAVVIRWALMERYAAQDAEETLALHRKNGGAIEGQWPQPEAELPGAPVFGVMRDGDVTKLYDGDGNEIEPQEQGDEGR